jgi:predicted N-acetyltransferase YhbS
MAVLPVYQKKGIGSNLIEEDLKRALQLKFNAVFVLGYRNYYPKFGLKCSSKRKINPPIEVLADEFMAIELSDGWLNDKSGIVEFTREYYDSTYSNINKYIEQKDELMSTAAVNL